VLFFPHFGSFFIFPFLFPNQSFLPSLLIELDQIKKKGYEDNQIRIELKDICNEMLEIDNSALKRGELKPLVSSIFQLHGACESTDPAKFLLTKLLISSSSINQLVEEIAWDPETLTRSFESPVSGDSSPVREWTSSPSFSHVSSNAEYNIESKNTILEFDLNGVCIFVSQNFPEVLGYLSDPSPLEYIGTSSLTFFSFLLLFFFFSFL